MHVTVKLRPEVGSLRKRKLIDAMRGAFRAGKVKDGFRICQIRVARRVNRRLGRKGKVFADRFHAVPVRSPRQLRNTLCYVLNNGLRHGEKDELWWRGMDPFSSAWHFDGWSLDRWRRGLDPPPGEPPVAPAESWLLTEGWLRWGRIGVGEVPRAAGPRAITREEWLGEPV